MSALSAHTAGDRPAALHPTKSKLPSTRRQSRGCRRRGGACDAPLPLSFRLSLPAFCPPLCNSSATQKHLHLRMASELGTELRAEGLDLCHQLHPHSGEKLLQCLCENVAGLCRASPPKIFSTTVTTTSTVTPPGSTTTLPFVPTDWTRSYSVTAGLCALFVAMCAVIIVLRIMSKRNDSQTRNRIR